MFIIFDLDGTLALNDHRQHFLEQSPKDWDSFNEACDKDQPCVPLIDVLIALANENNRIEIWSGRTDKVREKTELWLNDHDLDGFPLKMRAEGDFRTDVELKSEWLESLSQKPDLVFDDRQVMVDMWRRHGIICAQMAPGEF